MPALLVERVAPRAACQFTTMDRKRLTVSVVATAIYIMTIKYCYYTGVSCAMICSCSPVRPETRPLSFSRPALFVHDWPYFFGGVVHYPPTPLFNSVSSRCTLKATMG